MSRYLFCIVIFFTILMIQCSGRFVKKEELQYLQKKYSGIYVIKKPVDIGNNRKLKPGMRVKLFFQSGSESVKVYAYPANEPREEALGKNILYLFEEDFPKEKYSREVLEKKLNEIVEEIKAS
ncbi:MAG: type II secretion system-associated lipoprotein [Candidatus Hydrogenedentota bacterium]|nr:MAG: type II secretion system-associated lipoprotein [Candidatus Hydrogenedentota bacterium]